MPETAKALLAEMERTNRLLALLLVKGDTQKQAIEVLSSAGLRPAEIAETLGTTSGTVRTALAGIRKKVKTSRAARSSK